MVTSPVVLSWVLGGLGNQMFQYSAGRCLADKIGAKYHLDISAFKGYFRTYLLDRFNIRVDSFDSVENLPTISENSSFEYNEIVVGTNGAKLEGYWQNSKHFEHARKHMLKDLTPLKEYPSKLLDRIDTSDSISVHYRRGDYINIDCVQNICTEAYYTIAMNYIRARVSNPLFVLFSDDQTWLQGINMENAITCTVTDPVESMALMSRCKHNIICNSSFSWWGAWLNNNPSKVVIAPNKWHNTSPCQMVCPEDWKRL